MRKRGLENGFPKSSSIVGKPSATSEDTLACRYEDVPFKNSRTNFKPTLFLTPKPITMLANHAPQMPVESEGRKKYIGILLAYVQAINPTDAERIEMGVITQESIDSGKVKPVNYQEEDGRYRIDFWLKGKDLQQNEVTARHSVWIKDEIVDPSANSGNVQVANRKGTVAWIAPEYAEKGQTPYPDWFSTPYHRAKSGEADLLQFVNAWTNKRKGEDALELDFPALAKGNLKILQQVLSSGKASYVKVMLGVRTAENGREYQTVFPKVIVQAWMTNYEKLHKELANYLANSSARNDFGMDSSALYDRNLYTLRQHGQQENTQGQPVTGNPSSDNDWEGPSEWDDRATVAAVKQSATAPNQSPSDDDLPF